MNYQQAFHQYLCILNTLNDSQLTSLLQVVDPFLDLMFPQMTSTHQVFWNAIYAFVLYWISPTKNQMVSQCSTCPPLYLHYANYYLQLVLLAYTFHIHLPFDDMNHWAFVLNQYFEIINLNLCLIRYHLELVDLPLRRKLFHLEMIQINQSNWQLDPPDFMVITLNQPSQLYDWRQNSDSNTYYFNFEFLIHFNFPRLRAHFLLQVS